MGCCSSSTSVGEPFPRGWQKSFEKETTNTHVHVFMCILYIDGKFQNHWNAKWDVFFGDIEDILSLCKFDVLGIKFWHQRNSHMILGSVIAVITGGNDCLAKSMAMWPPLDGNWGAKSSFYRPGIFFSHFQSNFDLSTNSRRYLLTTWLIQSSKGLHSSCVAFGKFLPWLHPCNMTFDDRSWKAEGLTESCSFDSFSRPADKVRVESQGSQICLWER